MTSSINSSMGFMGMRRPDPAQLGSQLFSRLDTKNQGYIEKSDLQSAFEQVASSESASVDALFSQLDGDSDGKVTRDEMSAGMKKLAEELDSQFNSMRMNGFGGGEGMGAMGGMPPPPPPPGGDDEGFTQDELTSQLEEIGDSDSQRASLISNIVSNFDEADSDGDGKVSFKEAMAFDQSSSGTTAGSETAASASTSTSSEARMMRQLMQLLQAYGGSGQDAAQSGLASLLSASA